MKLALVINKLDTTWSFLPLIYLNTLRLNLKPKVSHRKKAYHFLTSILCIFISQAVKADVRPIGQLGPYKTR